MPQDWWSGFLVDARRVDQVLATTEKMLASTPNRAQLLNLLDALLDAANSEPVLPEHEKAIEDVGARLEGLGLAGGAERAQSALQGRLSDLENPWKPQFCLLFEGTETPVQLEPPACKPDSALALLYERDDRFLFLQRDRVRRAQSAREVAWAAPNREDKGRPQWVEDLAIGLAGIYQQTFEQFPDPEQYLETGNEVQAALKYSYAQHKQPGPVKIPQQHQAAWDRFRKSSLDRDALVRFAQRALRGAFDKMKPDQEPDKTHLANRSISPGAFVAWLVEEAGQQGWRGTLTLPPPGLEGLSQASQPSDGEADVDETGEPAAFNGMGAFGEDNFNSLDDFATFLKDGKLAFDPGLGVHEKYGPHGELFHLIGDLLHAQDLNPGEFAAFMKLRQWFATDGPTKSEAGQQVFNSLYDAARGEPVLTGVAVLVDLFKIMGAY